MLVWPKALSYDGRVALLPSAVCSLIQGSKEKIAYASSMNVALAGHIQHPEGTAVMSGI